MRAATADRVVAADPGTVVSVVVDVVNTGDIIDGISASVIGLPEECVTAVPAVLPLFPAAAGQLSVALSVPPTYPAGRHPLTVALNSHGAAVPPTYLDVDLDVAPRPAMAMVPSPRVVRARRSGRFSLQVTNTGNVPLDIALEAVDVDRASKATFAPPRLRVDPGVTAPVLLHVRGPRMFTGGESDRPVQVVATATRADLAPDADPDPSAPQPEPREALVKLRQRPLVSRGLLTALVLLTIIGMWAGVFLLGLTKVFSNDPVTKAAPASFFVASQGTGAAGTGAQNATGGDAASANGGAPAGALPKSGQLPPGVGGQIIGTVTSASTEQPVGEIVVEAYRVGSASKLPVSSAATQSDGTFSLAGLFPTQYYLKFSAPKGFTPVWYPSSPSKAGARPVDAAAEGTTSGINTVIRGLPASISGTVDPGDTTHSVTTTVTALPLNVAGGNARSRTVTTTGGKYTLPALAAPATYQLTFVTPGYQTSTMTDSVGGGDTRLEPTVTLGAAQGGITGIVVNGSTYNSPPVGGATVTTTVGGRTISVMTPTAGAIGTFAIPNLPTPGTYVLNYSAPGHGTWTEVIALHAGESNTKALGQLTAGSGTITGRVVDGGSKAGLGGVTVTLGGAVPTSSTDGTVPVSTSAPTTTTLTSGDIGSFYLNGIADGSYTLTFTLDGYTSASVPVTLDSTKPQTPGQNGARILLYKQRGEISGTVVTGTAGDGLAGATVTATDGTNTFTTTTSAPGGALAQGGYDLTGLAPGTYSVTVTATDYEQQTQLVHLGHGQIRNGRNFDLTATPTAGG